MVVARHGTGDGHLAALKRQNAQAEVGSPLRCQRKGETKRKRQR